MWQTYIISPLTDLLHTLLSFSGDIGLAIILFTLIIKTVLLPINISATRTTKNLRKIQKEIENLKNKHKGDNLKLGTELNKLYKENNIKPFSSFLGIFIQIPVLFALYSILLKEVKTGIDHITLFNINVTEVNYFLALLAFVSMVYLMTISTKDMIVNDNATEFQKEFNKIMKLQMKYFLPVIFGFGSLFLPSGIVIYFIISNIYGIFQYILINKYIK